MQAPDSTSKRLICCLAAVLVSLAIIRADQPKSVSVDKPPAAATKTAERSKPSGLGSKVQGSPTQGSVRGGKLSTGSLAPQAPKRPRMARPSFSPLYVIDQEQIQRSGAGNTAELLRRATAAPR